MEGKNSVQYVAPLLVFQETGENFLVVFKKNEEGDHFADIILKVWLKAEQVRA